MVASNKEADEIAAAVGIPTCVFAPNFTNVNYPLPTTSIIDVHHSTLLLLILQQQLEALSKLNRSNMFQNDWAYLGPLEIATSNDKKYRELILKVQMASLASLLSTNKGRNHSETNWFASEKYGQI
jgi:hypothetical protein